MHEAVLFKPSAETAEKTPTHLAKKNLEEVELSSFNGTLCLRICCQIWESKRNMTNCLDVWIIHLPPPSPTPSTGTPLLLLHLPLHMLFRTSYPRQSQSTTSSSAVALRQGERDFSPVKGHGSAWLISHARWACPGRPGPAAKEVEWIRLREGRGGVRGGGGEQKLRLHANKHRVSQCHANINSPWQFLSTFDTVPPACHSTPAIVTLAWSVGFSDSCFLVFCRAWGPQIRVQMPFIILFQMLHCDSLEGISVLVLKKKKNWVRERDCWKFETFLCCAVSFF